MHVSFQTYASLLYRMLCHTLALTTLCTGCSVILASSPWRLCSLGQYHLCVTSAPQRDVTWLVKVLFDVKLLATALNPQATVPSSQVAKLHHVEAFEVWGSRRIIVSLT